MNNAELQHMLKEAWAAIPTPPRRSVGAIERECGAEAYCAFAGVHPLNVDTRSAGFHAAMPLFDLGPKAAAAYLGTFLLSVLRSLDYQNKVGIHDDILTRPHTLFFLMSEDLDSLILRHMSPMQVSVVRNVANYFASCANELSLRSDEVERLERLGRG